MFQGLYTALITPFKNGKVDEQAFQDFVEWQVKEGVHGLVPCGTTGESPTLSAEEHERVIKLCVEAANGKVPVMAGTGSNSTEATIAKTRVAKKAGADAVLVVAPYYNKPSQEGLYRHYKAINDAVDIPVFLYNVPSRAVVDIADDTVADLAALKNIVGIKDATGDLERPYLLRRKLKHPFRLFTGEDMSVVAYAASGGVGCISVTSNIMPRRCAEVQNACLKGDFKKALKLQDTLVELHAAMFCESNPGPVKFAASLIGKSRPDVRLPLGPISDNGKKSVRQALKNLRLI